MSVTPLFILSHNPASALDFPFTSRVLNWPYSKPFHFDGMTDPKPLVTPPSPPTIPNSNEQTHSRTLRSSSPRQRVNAVPRQRPSANPLVKTSEQGRNQRREQFLNRVQQRREDNRWNVRGDQILQLDYITQQRAWEAQLAQAAPNFDPDFDDEMENEVEAQRKQQSTGSQQQFQMPWLQTQSQPSQRMNVSMDDQLQLSQPSQLEYLHQSLANNRSDTQKLRALSGSSQDQNEIDEILAAEQRVLEALVALHEAQESNSHEGNDGSDEMLDGLPAIKRDEQNQVIGSDLANAASSPVWGSDDAEFEEELLRLGDDAMDVS